MNLGSCLDEVLEMCSGQKVAQIDKLTVLFVLDWMARENKIMVILHTSLDVMLTYR